MTIPTHNDLMLAVLSMDSYTYHQEGVWKVGNATVFKNADQSYGFAAVAYKYDGQTIISYRGTDGYYLGDAWYSWGGGIIGAESTQAGLAAKFYQDVAGADNNSGTTFPYSTLGSVVFTGHSLGGGLAGLMAGLYGQEAVVFDNMAYTAAIAKTYNDATHTIGGGTDPDTGNPTQIIYPENVNVLNTFYNGATPLPTNTSHITGFQLDGQIIQNTQSTGTVVGGDVDWGLGALNLHSIALLVLNMFADLQLHLRAAASVRVGEKAI
jgi:hypothetical protein